MKRLTTDTPDGNFETMINLVFSKDGWAHIRHDVEKRTVPLTQWAKAQCVLHGCGKSSAEMTQEIDEEISDCLMMDFPDCPIALAYGFAVQACHLRSRLKMYEDIFFANDGTERLPLDVLRDLAERTVPSPPNDPLTLEELREMDLFEWLWVEVIHPTERQVFRKIESAYYQVFEDYTDGESLCCGWPGLIQSFEYMDYGKNWLAYRRKPEEGEL